MLAARASASLQVNPSRRAVLGGLIAAGALLGSAGACGRTQNMVVRRVDFGYYIRPASDTGTGVASVVPCLGYLVDHPNGLVLMDTGIGRDPEVDTYYRPRRRYLSMALDAVGARPEDIRLVINCHLHFDHCGGNPKLPGRDIIVQAIELQTARRVPEYTSAALIDAPSLHYQQLNGEAEVWPGLLVVPTPGHTAGHQSLVARFGDGTVVLAGQSHETASAYSADALDETVRDQEGLSPLPPTPAWMHRLRELDPKRVVFAHDHAVWEP